MIQHRPSTRFLSRWLMLLMLVMSTSLAASAIEAYACYTPSNTTLTFYYDNYRNSRPGTTFDLSTGAYPSWLDISDAVTHVVFNSSFANARPTSTQYWFGEMEELISITGMQYLNTSQVTNMSGMFNDCISLTSLDVSHFNTSRVTDMSSMFSSCSIMGLDVSNFDTSKVIDMSWMFSSCSVTALDVSNFNTSKVTNMNHMFSGCSNLTRLDVAVDYGNWNSSNVTNMDYMFNDCSSLTSIDLSQFNTSNVTSMDHMFNGCSSLTSIDLSGFNTAKVTNMNEMFRNCDALTELDLEFIDFNTSKVTSMNYMFAYCDNLVRIYVGSGWSTVAVTTSNNMFKDSYRLYGEKGTTYNASHVDASYAHVDGGPSNPGYMSDKKEAYACYTPSNHTLTFYYDDYRSSRTGTTYDLNTGSNDPAWYTDGINSDVTSVLIASSFADARPTTTYRWFFGMSLLQSIRAINYLNTSSVTNMAYMFYGCNKLTSLDLSNFNTSKVTDMSCMFACEKLTSLDLSSFNTSNVTSMNSMFGACIELTSIDLSSFNTSNVTNMAGMFDYCLGLKTLDLSSFNTSKVTNMVGMFEKCSSLTGLDLSSFNTANVTRMDHMFQECSSLTSLDLSSFNTANVTRMYNMFQECSSLTSLDLSSFNTSNVTNMASMFDYCLGLKTLDLSSFNTSNVTNMSDMFEECYNLQTIYVSNGWSTASVISGNGDKDMFTNSTRLVGGKGTVYDANHVNADYAHIDGGPSNPGYLTDKNAIKRGDVNGDGNVTISDVTALIDLLLGGGTINNPAADCNNDSNVTISDVTALIDFLLGGSW